jgi:hypothetical protein
MITSTLPRVRPSPRESSRRRDRADSWLQWKLEAPAEPARLTVAELAECRCPDLCDRDHQNE